MHKLEYGVGIDEHLLDVELKFRVTQSHSMLTTHNSLADPGARINGPFYNVPNKKMPRRGTNPFV